jgi:hypothetical protein
VGARRQTSLSSRRALKSNSARTKLANDPVGSPFFVAVESRVETNLLFRMNRNAWSSCAFVRTVGPSLPFPVRSCDINEQSCEAEHRSSPGRSNLATWPPPTHRLRRRAERCTRATGSGSRGYGAWALQVSNPCASARQAKGHAADNNLGRESRKGWPRRGGLQRCLTRGNRGARYLRTRVRNRTFPFREGRWMAGRTCHLWEFSDLGGPMNWDGGHSFSFSPM